VNYKDLAQKLACSESDVRNSLRRVRRSLRAILLEILKADADSEVDIESQMQELFLSL
jgi:DNA-directed RNA polymerase specialized sigma24 family protein